VRQIWNCYACTSDHFWGIAAGDKKIGADCCGTKSSTVGRKGCNNRGTQVGGMGTGGAWTLIP
jgi:hypothetical protein